MEGIKFESNDSKLLSKVVGFRISELRDKEFQFGLEDYEEIELSSLEEMQIRFTRYLILGETGNK